MPQFFVGFLGNNFQARIARYRKHLYRIYYPGKDSAIILVDHRIARQQQAQVDVLPKSSKRQRWITKTDDDIMELSPKMRQTVKSQNSLNGEFDSWGFQDERSHVN